MEQVSLAQEENKREKKQIGRKGFNPFPTHALI
jgi:hypothetical protein